MQNQPISVSEQILWATSLYTIANPVHDQIVESIKRFMYDEENRHDVSIASGIAENVKSGLFESRFDFFETEDPVIKTLKSFCATAILEVAKHVNDGYWEKDGNFSLEFHESWFHITREGGFHDFHNHPNCSWCAIYYLDIGDSAGTDGGNAFFDPRPAAHNYNDYGTAYLDGKTRFDTTPKEDNLVIFPSYLYHSAPPYHGAKDRIIIAMNSSIHYDP